MFELMLFCVVEYIFENLLTRRIKSDYLTNYQHKIYTYKDIDLEGHFEYIWLTKILTNIKGPMLLFRRSL